MSPGTTDVGADVIVNTLESYGVRHVFGNPGTTELPVIKAIAESNECDYVMALQEDIAVGMAAGYAKTRTYHAHHDEDVCQAGVVNLHAAPGLAHGLGNLHGASYTGAPLVITAGIQSTGFQHEEPMLSGDMVEMTQQFTKWSSMVNDVDALPTMLRRAFRIALTPPTGPVFLGLPLDVVQDETKATVEPLGPIPDAGRGDRDQIQHAADYLVDANEPVMVVGDHVARSGADAVDAAVNLAEAAGTRVYGEILAGEVNFPGSHELWHSYLPPAENIAREHMKTDTLLLVGCSTNTTITAPESPLVEKNTNCIHISPDPWELGKNEHTDAAIIGDPEPILSQLSELVADRISAKERENRIQAAKADTAADNGMTNGDGGTVATKPEFVDELRSVIPDAFLVDESVTTKYVLLDRWPLEKEQFLSTKGGGLGYGLPSVVGAAIAESLRPHPRDVVGTIGDGSFFYYPQTLYSAARYGVDLTVVIPDNRSYTVLKNNTVDLLGGSTDDYDFDEMGLDLEPRIDIESMVASQNVSAHTVEVREDIATTVEQAVAESGPSLVDVVIQD